MQVRPGWVSLPAQRVLDSETARRQEHSNCIAPVGPQAHAEVAEPGCNSITVWAKDIAYAPADAAPKDKGGSRSSQAGDAYTAAAVQNGIPHAKATKFVSIVHGASISAARAHSADCREVCHRLDL